MIEIEFVVRSGSGFLVSPESLHMIADPKDPAAAAIQARRYTKQADAEDDIRRLQDAGIDAEPVELRCCRLGMR